ncbi:MAG: recombination protein RecR [Flavobacteriales bacterium]|nr:recombination protein RecR [Flavobacteriales bacterium]MBT6745290.1 recombination protein RecR [Flavobacteriales bacterium]
MLQIDGIFGSLELPSKHIQAAVEQMASLPGVGRKTALRLVLHLLNQDNSDVRAFGKAFVELKDNVQFCKTCHNVSDAQLCSICSSYKREASTVCVVEDMRNVIAIENTQQYTGVYHVLGGIISPMDGIGPSELNIESLVNRVKQGEIKEVIMALSTTIEGDTTNFYIYKRLSEFDVEISTIARGVAIGDDLEYTDEITLGRSLLNRVPYNSGLVKN